MLLPWRTALLLLAPLASALRDLGPKDRCLEKVKGVQDGVYGRWFSRKLSRLFFDDPFQVASEGYQTVGDFQKDLLTRLEDSLLYHCRLFVSQGSCAGIRNARFGAHRLPRRRVFPAKISPGEECFSKTGGNETAPAIVRQERCQMVRCYRELLEKRCLSSLGLSPITEATLHDSCV
ncbi:hypothetical protein AK812_SmicGene21694 [Symbiodinium microadriaticum]|uniref:Uncharacterized protein n=1 Tax=Symbiodinium microadriaticum TaxID=2951 RepID=A0A1Q9DLR5_SYMMI|nr:hypothetical protein AK812_SmicGene21694 [Symbiodinium microadriaticum]